MARGKKRGISIYDYYIKNCPEQCIELLTNKYGYKTPNNTGELKQMMINAVKENGAEASADFANFHPDKDLILKNATLQEYSNACGCSLMSLDGSEEELKYRQNLRHDIEKELKQEGNESAKVIKLSADGLLPSPDTTIKYLIVGATLIFVGTITMYLITRRG